MANKTKNKIKQKKKTRTNVSELKAMLLGPGINAAMQRAI